VSPLSDEALVPETAGRILGKVAHVKKKQVKKANKMQSVMLSKIDSGSTLQREIKRFEVDVSIQDLEGVISPDDIDHPVTVHPLSEVKSRLKSDPVYALTKALKVCDMFRGPPIFNIPRVQKIDYEWTKCFCKPVSVAILASLIKQEDPASFWEKVQSK
jgi:hypothetical protein